MVHLSTRQAERFISDGVVEALTAAQTQVVSELRAENVIPCLGVALVEGDMGVVDGPSVNYVDRKMRHGELIGATSITENCGRWAVGEMLQAWASDPTVHGAMLQLPLPAHNGETPQLLHSRTASRLRLIPAEKDVDGLRPEEPGFPAATPAGIMRLLREQTRIPLEDKPKVLVVGSEGYLIGRHMKPLLQKAGITPVRHDKALFVEPTPERLENELRVKLAMADIVVSCAGVPGIIRPDMLHNGMVIIDAGVRVVGGKVRGDLDPSIADSPLDVLYTGPTKGVGPLTVCELWQNTITAAIAQTTGRSV